MYKKKSILFLLAICLITIVFLLILKFQNYSLLEVTADNYKKLKESNHPIYLSGIDNCIPDKISILHSNGYAEKNNSEINEYEIEKIILSTNYYKVTINSQLTNLTYNAWFKEDRGIVIAQIVSQHFDKALKQLADNLMTKEGFILKKTELKNGSDILIKETKDNFIIAELVGTYENPPPMSIYIKSYSKRKFF